MQVWIVDAFAEARYRGNPAGVIVVERFPVTERMQSIAFGLGLPTTAFVVRDREDRYHIRWFTPEKELDLCGHATIATASYLYERGGVAPSGPLQFHTRSGPLYTHREGALITIDLPRMDTVECAPPPGLAEAVRAKIVRCLRASDDLLIELESESEVARIRPDFERMKRIECRGHVVTARGEQTGADFVSRSFFPALGVDEDQVCVSAHCKLGPYWAGRLGKHRLSAVQLSERGGRLLVAVNGARIQVSGAAAVRRSMDVTSDGSQPAT